MLQTVSYHCTVDAEENLKSFLISLHISIPDTLLFDLQIPTKALTLLQKHVTVLDLEIGTMKRSCADQLAHTRLIVDELYNRQLDVDQAHVSAYS